MPKGWKYYNYAMLPVSAPHESVDKTALNDGTIWNKNKAVMAVWVDGWDSPPSEWWYLIRESPFDISSLTKSSRKNIKKALGNCTVKKIQPLSCVNELWTVYVEAVERYKNYRMTISKSDFIVALENKPHNVDYWAAYSKDEGKMIGYKICTVYDDWCDFTTSKYSSKYLKMRASDALNYIVLEEYLNNQKKKYVSNGSRSILHCTNVQKYYEEHFLFRKCYCHLHIKYRWPINLFVKFFYPIWKVAGGGDFKFIILNKINAIFKLEEYARACNNTLQQ